MDIFEKELIKKLFEREKNILNTNDISKTNLLDEVIKLDKDYLEVIRGQNQNVDRLVVMITRDCQLNCKYCTVKKSKEYISENLLFKSIDLLLTSKSNEVELQYFGGEPLLNFPLIKKSVEYSKKIARQRKKNIKYLITTNGLNINDEIIEYFEKIKMKVELSLDGKRKNSESVRISGEKDSYYEKLIQNTKKLINSKIEYRVISVFTPERIDEMVEDIEYLLKLGIKNIQLNYSLMQYWSKEKIKRFIIEYEKVKSLVKKYKGALVNESFERYEPVLLNADPIVDCNGNIYLEFKIFFGKILKNSDTIFSFGNVNKIKDISMLASNRYENYKKILKLCEKSDKQIRKIIRSNVEFGFELGKNTRGK